jgi:hypothetical protein
MKKNLQDVWEYVAQMGLGYTVDIAIQPQDIEDPELAALWAEAQVKMNEIQIYLETKLGIE